ncbi:hypothetical protein VHP8226_00288 [Vibrio hippocampi]|uniref:Uncharacterized protein n=1 Tax=Vibrio hippocampi TaxID=654686 RepID=A0ABM8ZEY3_9VIBR|nr:hypothetical protein VHP8226_00288 [Vibrio hippocampi]
MRLTDVIGKHANYLTYISAFDGDVMELDFTLSRSEVAIVSRQFYVANPFTCD